MDDMPMNPVEEQRQAVEPVAPVEPPLRPNEVRMLPGKFVPMTTARAAKAPRQPVNWQPVVDAGAKWADSKTFTVMVLILFASAVFGAERVGNWIEGLGVGTVATFIAGGPVGFRAAQEPERPVVPVQPVQP